jgi:hypothetical protein
MSYRLIAAIFALALCAFTAEAQLHLITGSPNPSGNAGYRSALFRITTDGAIEKVVDLVTDRAGTEWVAASQELGKAVLVPKRLGQPVVVVGFDQAAIVKQCVAPDTGWALIERWIWNPPGTGPVYVEYLASGNETRTRSMILDPAVPCDRSFAPISPADAAHLAAAGQAGVADAGGYDWMHVWIGKGGELSRFFRHGMAHFDYLVPPMMHDDLRRASAMVVANNRWLFALSLIDFDSPSSYRLLLFRKSDKTWHRMPNLGEGTGYERAFGAWIAAAATVRKGPTDRQSAGPSEWRMQATTTGPSMRGLFHDSYAVFPGRLYLYDVSTDRAYTIVTNQGDSEVLLVQDGVVYYRASDRLYSATIANKGLSPGRLLLTSEVIRDAHWAFVKR